MPMIGGAALQDIIRRSRPGAVPSVATPAATPAPAATTPPATTTPPPSGGILQNGVPITGTDLTAGLQAPPPSPPPAQPPAQTSGGRPSNDRSRETAGNAPEGVPNIPGGVPAGSGGWDTNAKGLWNAIGQGFGKGLDAQLRDIQLQTSTNQRRAIETAATGGGSALGGAMQAGQAQAQLGGMQMANRAISETEKNKLGAQMAYLQMQMDRAKQERNIEGAKEIQQLIDETQVALAQAEAGIVAGGAAGASGAEASAASQLPLSQQETAVNTFVSANNMSNGDIPGARKATLEWMYTNGLIDLTGAQIQQFFRDFPAKRDEFFAAFKAATGQEPQVSSGSSRGSLIEWGF